MRNLKKLLEQLKDVPVETTAEPELKHNRREQDKKLRQGPQPTTSHIHHISCLLIFVTCRMQRGAGPGSRGGLGSHSARGQWQLKPR
jgi:hypothetical protein